MIVINDQKSTTKAKQVYLKMLHVSISCISTMKTILYIHLLELES